MDNGKNDIAACDAVRVEPRTRPVDFRTAVPGAKSIANRALLLAGAAHGRSRLRRTPDSGDIRAALSALAGLGVGVAAGGEPGEWLVEGRGLDFPTRRGVLDIRSSGTVGRFLPGILAAAADGDWTLAATDQLARRPIAPLLDALERWGADIRRENRDLSFPLRVVARGLAGGETAVSAAGSSQFASGLLIAAPLARRDAVVAIRDLDPDEAYIDITLDLMRRFGVEAESAVSGTGRIVAVPPRPYRAADLEIEADYNSAAYFLCLPLLLGGTAAVTNLSRDSLQPGRRFLELDARLGGRVESGDGGVAVAADGGPLRGGFDIDMRAMSEMALTLGVLAPFADAPIAMTNLAHIRGHETDRLAALARLLGVVGVRCELGDDWIRVHPADRRSLKAATIDSMDDHRLVMSFSLLAAGGNGLVIRNPGAVAKTFPDFFAVLAECGIGVRGE